MGAVCGCTPGTHGELKAERMSLLARKQSVNASRKPEEKKETNTQEFKEIPLVYTEEMVRKACDPKEYANRLQYPYINYLPFTIPSLKYRYVLSTIYNMKFPKIEPKKFLSFFRNLYSSEERMKTYDIKNKSLCKIKKELLNNVKCEWIEYEGCSINNGIIIGVHGGGYFLHSCAYFYAMSELISRLTGCPVLLIDYKLAPEHPLPYCVNELINVYKYLLNKYKNINISMFGNSAGGGCILLAMQSMIKENINISFIACLWLISPWTNIACDTNSAITNEKFVSIDYKSDGYKQFLDCLKNFPVGNYDIECNKIANNDLSLPIYSPKNGSFKNFCPVYFVVGAMEGLVDEILICAKQLYGEGIDVVVDIDPYMFHASDAMVNTFDEAKYIMVRGSQWMSQHLSKNKKQK